MGSRVDWIRKTLSLFLAVAMATLATGCWSKNELTELAFVMGVALDLRDDGKIEMLTQVYRPSSTEIGKSNSTIVGSSVNIKTVDDTVMEAIRDIPIHLGRKAQWSHMRVIIVGEKLARSRNLIQTLDFFYRDHEPRNSVSLMISKGKAAKLFEKQPLIEQTTSQQVLRTNEAAYRNAAKTLDTTLLDLVRHIKGAHKDTVIAYIYEDQQVSQFFSAAGLVLLKNGKMKYTLPANRVEGFLMLIDQYKSGAVEIPCPDSKTEMETAEVVSLQATVNPKVVGDDVKLSINIHGEITINELKCTKINTVEEETAFVDAIAQRIKEQASDSFGYLQKRRMDAMDLGNRIYRSDPKAWMRMKSDWDTRFAAIPVDIKVKLKLITGGTISSKTMS